jgi:diaminopimelate epimerase
MIVYDFMDSGDADVRVVIFNNDGSRPEACGNATRCVALLVDQKRAQTDQGAPVTIRSDAGLLKCALHDHGIVSVDMGVPRLNWADIPLSKEQDIKALDGLSDIVQSYHVLSQPSAVNIGNPHCVFFVSAQDIPDDPLLTEMGKRVEHHALFPQKTNVEFLALQQDGSIRLRVWERGTGITQACGSAACAVAVAAVLRSYKNYDEEIKIVLDGGVLSLNWPAPDQGIIMRGPTSLNYSGFITLPLEGNAR